MLKRLELVGFKSFAEKTQFDFGPGITAIVGPNGSGKSNVVDAVRWILGEQSAKSLRGGEMADVIFNGSSTRRSLGLAEVTLVVDNGRRRLAHDADEVQVTRRVYRNGEGEYLINKLPVRLRDVKELFLGSGAGASAYCIIEQGRVDVLLQSSTKERRIIFEEAAGISRFKAKKIEAQRKLEHVEQNLLRLRDLTDEVNRQLQSVQAQATKAQRHQEYAGRLRELRVAQSLADYQRLQTALGLTQEELTAARAELANRGARTSALDAELAQLDAQVEQAHTRRQAQETALSEVLQRLATATARSRHEMEQVQDSEQELAAVGLRLLAQRQAAATQQSDVRGAQELAETLATQWREREETVVGLQTTRQALRDATREQRDRLRQSKIDLLDQMRTVARLHNEHVSIVAQLEGLKQHRRRLEQQGAQVSHSLSQVGTELRQLQDAERIVHDKSVLLREQLGGLRGQQARDQQALQELQRVIQEERSKQSALASRQEVLETLEHSREGLGAGVRHVLGLLEQPDSPLASAVHGMVAGLLSARREYAHLIDLALCERSQWFVLRDVASMAVVQRNLPSNLEGRVTFWSPTSANSSVAVWTRQGKLSLPVIGASLPAHPGIVARANDLVTTEHSLAAELPNTLLGQVLIVADAETAWDLAPLLTGYSFVTLSGAILDANGAWTLGEHHAELGILSRKSELRQLRDEAQALASQIASREREVDERQEQLRRVQAQIEQLEPELQVSKEQATDLRTRVFQLRQRQDGLSEEAQLSATELRQIDDDLARLGTTGNEAQATLNAARDGERSLQQAIDQLETDLPPLEKQLELRQQELAMAQVDAAKAQERHQAAAARAQELRLAEERRQRDVADTLATCGRLRERLERSQLAALHAGNDIAELVVAKERTQAVLSALDAEVASLQESRHGVLEQVTADRQSLQALQDAVHAHALRANEISHDANVVVVRLREEHEVDLLEVYATYQPPAEAPDATARQEEIQDLRRKIARLGSVNLDALQELAQLAERARHLQAQQTDLEQAKQSLDDVIDRINQDSRRAFTETYESIRMHFQELFRKLFGGGMADVILEDESDVLESGIEIIARPPGKELRSISLLSGGEKTLTAVALLLAIFRSKPSPFCILDEVDAALDEANTGRLATVLQDFAGASQFIMITHSKRTMTAANVLYGVTMQEAGVSKRVAVRLEDWPDEQPAAGQLRSAA